jgi:TM2 domain-containing membrane protein YozV
MTATTWPLAAIALKLAPFCTGCGVKLPVLRAAAVACPHCGDELVRSDGTRASAWPWKPWLCAAASLLLPGSGQAWNGQPGKALAFLLTFWLVVPWIWSVIDAWRVARDASLAPARARA